MRTMAKQCFLPLLVIIGGLVVGMSLRPFGGWLPWLALLLLYLLSTAPVSGLLMKGLERYRPLDLASCPSADAIVVLGGGPPRYSPELPGLQPTAMTLERVRYGALLHRQCDAPVLVTGGGNNPEAPVMANVLHSDYGVDGVIQETQSRTTRENALHSRQVLGEENRRVILVTHGWHMPRAVFSFQQAGFEVIPAPTAFRAGRVAWNSVSYWLPRGRHFRNSEIALHEYLGMLWYQLQSLSKV